MNCAQQQQHRISPRHVLMTALGAILIILVVYLINKGTFYPATIIYVKEFYGWLQGLGAWLPIMFILFNIFIVLFFIPGPIVTLGAGSLFGFIKGTAIVIFGTTIGALIAFNIGRYLFNKRARARLMQHPRLRFIEEEFVQEGYQFIMLTRIIPLFPFKPSNYFFGAANFSQKHFLIGTVIGIIPFTCLNVYIGSVATDVGRFLSGNNDDFYHNWWLYAFGFLLIILGIAYVYHHTRIALLRYSKMAGAGKNINSENRGD